MQILRRSILPLIQRRELATSPALASLVGSASPCFRSFMAAAAAAPPRCCWRGDLLPLPPSAPPDGPVRRPVCQAKTRASAGPHTNFRVFHNGSRNMTSTTGIKGEDLGEPAHNGEQDGRRTGVHDDEKKNEVTRTRDDTFLRCGEGPPGGELSKDGDFASSEDEQFCSDADLPEDVGYMSIIPYSTHRHGSIYRGVYGWKLDYRIADRNETRFEAKMFSNPQDCIFYRASCRRHMPRRMFQIFSLKLAKIQVEGGPVELYGYIAARDIVDQRLNYVVNFNRDDPILMDQGSLIEMTGPKRGIEFYYATLIEYDMRIKTGKQEKDDLQLIDGVSIIDEMSHNTRKLFTRRIHGDHGAVDITGSRVNDAVEATVEVVVSEVQGNFSLCVGCFISVSHEEIRLFDGIISESRDLRRSVVAVEEDTWMNLNLKVGLGPHDNSDDDDVAEHCCTFKAAVHGYTHQLVKVKFATILVKVTWSTLSMST